MIDFRKKKLGPSIQISEVEPIEKILKRFGSGSMSHGALSKEAHETLAIGMNWIKRTDIFLKILIACKINLIIIILWVIQTNI